MEKFELLTILNVILLIAFFFILYKIFIYTKKIKGKWIALAVVGLVFVMIPKNCESGYNNDMQQIIDNVIKKREVKKKYKIFELENNINFTFQNMQIRYLVYFDENNELKIFDEQVMISGLIIGTMFDEIPSFTNVENISSDSYQITSELEYFSFFFKGDYTVKKVFSAEEIRKMSSQEGQKYFIHYPKFEKPTYHY